LDSKEVLKKISRLSFIETEEHLEEHLKRMLEFVKVIDELHLDDVEPMSYPHNLSQRLREDKRGKCLKREDILRNAPDTYLKFFRMPSPIPVKKR